MRIDEVHYKTKSFISEMHTSSMAYEIKRTRAEWDPTLAVPGTNRRGGWRCPVGTRYGGEITDRFGRNCGWGAVRRLGNEISDLGERLENISEGRRERRAARDAERNAARAGRGAGRIERAAGRIARALDTPDDRNDATPKTPRQRRGGMNVPRGGNLRMSEERRMQREIDKPNPRPAAGQARRRRATAAAARNKPAPARRNEFGDAQDVNRIINDREFANYDDAKLAKLRDAAQGFNDDGNIIAEGHLNVLDAEIARRRQPVKKAVKKKAPAKKAPAKKAVVKKVPAKKVPAKKAATRRVTPAAGGDAEPARMATQPPARAAARNTDVRPIRDFTGFDVYNDDMSEAAARIDALDPAVDPVDYNESIMELVRHTERLRRENPDMVLELPDGEQVTNRQFRRNLIDAMQAWTRYGERSRAQNAARPATPPRAATPAQAEQPLDGLRQVFNGREIGWRRNYPQQEREVLARVRDIPNMDEAALLNRRRTDAQLIAWNREYFNNIQLIDPEREIQMENGVVKAKDLKKQIKALLDAYDGQNAAIDARLQQLNQNRLPGQGNIRWMNGQKQDGFESLAEAKQHLNEIVDSRPESKWHLVKHNDRHYVVTETQLNEIRLAGGANIPTLEQKGGLPLANQLPPIDDNVARQAEKRVKDTILKRQKILADHLNKRYGEGNAPWLAMTNERREELLRLRARGDRNASRELSKWAEDMYSHAEIEGQNGKTYRTVASASFRDNTEINVNVRIQRQNPDGTWVNVGESYRNIHIGSNPPWVYNARMFITNPADKNSGIQTVYNQHAFMYAKAAGFKFFKVSAVDDGRFVWGKVGFKETLTSNHIARINNEVVKFREGRPSLIDNDSDARIIEHLVGSYIRDPQSVRHLDFIMGISNNERTEAQKKARATKIKGWFTENMTFSSGTFDLAENDILPDPRRRGR